MNNNLKNKNSPTCELLYHKGVANIIIAMPTGTWDVEYTRKIKEQVKKMSEKFNGQKWYFIGNIELMNTIEDPEVSKEFSKVNEEYFEKGCKEVIFVTKEAIAIKVQSRWHYNKSSADELITEYVKSEEEAIELIQNSL